jgi:hypothetical protein
MSSEELVNTAPLPSSGELRRIGELLFGAKPRFVAYGNGSTDAGGSADAAS